MTTKTRNTSPSDPETPAAQTGPGYEEWLEAEIAAGLAEIEAGRVTPADKVWSALGIE